MLKQWILLYRKRSQSWNLPRRLRKFFCLERANIVGVQGASEDEKFAAKPTWGNSNFVTVFGICACLITSVFLQAGSVRLFNNSNFDLRAVVRGSDSSYLGELVVRSQNTATWTDSYSYAGGYNGPNAQVESGYRSKTPYVVNWYCMDGADFAVCDTVSTGAVVMSLQCMGPRICHAPPKKRGAYPTIPGGQYLQPEDKQP